jgi:hypothetical protein
MHLRSQTRRPSTRSLMSESTRVKSLADKEKEQQVVWVHGSHVQRNTALSALQHSTAQHSTAQHSTPQHTTAHHSTPQHTTAHHSTTQHSTAHHTTAMHTTVKHSCTAMHSTAQHSTAQHSTAQHSTAQHSTAPKQALRHVSLVRRYLHFSLRYRIFVYRNELELFINNSSGSTFARNLAPTSDPLTVKLKASFELTRNTHFAKQASYLSSFEHHQSRECYYTC